MLISRPLPASRPPRLSALTTLSLGGLLATLLAGCGTGNSPAINATAQANTRSAAAGNWKFTTGSSAFAGSIAVTGNAVSGLLHPLSRTCGTSSDAFSVTGSIDASGSISMTSSNFSGGRLAISGILATDKHSLVTPSITVTGPTCATPATLVHSLSANPGSTPTAQQYQPLTGNYSGTFTDISGSVLVVAASLSQPTTPDANGVYHLTGNATFPDSPCLSAPVITDSTVTGDSIQATYTDQQSGNTVIANGTFSADAQTLTITSWILSGCGGDTGTGLLVRQTN